MIKQRFLLIINLLMLFTLALQAGSIKGHVVNSKGGQGVSYASIAIIKAGQTDALAGSISDKERSFIIKNIPNGNYNAVVSFIGFKTKEINNITVSSKEHRVELGTCT
jgi:hypothetical protein